MTCDWDDHSHRYLSLRERFKPGMQFKCQGKEVTIFSVDFDEATCIVRPHDNPVNLVVVDLEDLE